MSAFQAAPRWGPLEAAAPRRLVVLLHGLGADGFDLIDLAPGWARAVPGAVFVAPHGFEACDLSPYGRQWFSLADRTPARVAAGAGAAAARLGPAILAEAASLGLTAGQVALMGFSQGCMMALSTGLRLAPPLAGILGYAGALPDSAGLPGWIAARPPVCLLHGEEDGVVPVSAGRAAAAARVAAGVDVETHWRPGLDHGLDEAGISAGGLFLQRVLGGA